MTNIRTTSLKDWLPTVGLGSASFIFVTTELLPVGLLPDIALGMGKTEAATGLLLTVYAWSVALLSLPLTVLTSRWDRRKLILALLAVFIIGNTLCSLATNFVALIAARLCIAMAHAIFWSIATPLAIRVAPPGGKARALGIIVVGTSLATILGVPLGALLGHQLGWRAAFGAVAVVAFIIFLTLWRLLPPDSSDDTGSFRDLPELVRNKPLISVYLLTVVAISGHFLIFTYFTSFMQQVGDFEPETIAFLLLILGLSGLAGSVLGGKFAELPGRKPVLFPLLSLCLLMLILSLAAKAGVLFTMAVCFAWGVAFTFVTMVFQLRVLSHAARYTDIATSIYSGIFNVGIGGGALMGSWVFAHIGLAHTAYASALFFSAAALLVLWLLPSRSDESGYVN